MRALGGVLLWVVLCLAGGANAQDVDARQEFERGTTAYEQGDYDRAIEAWQRAYSADPRPLILFNLSQAYERLGRMTDAIDALDRYLSSASPNDPNQADARARLSALRERLSRTGVVVRGAPDGAAISVDDQSWGRAPRPDAIALSPGSHRVGVTMDGYEDFQATVVVPAGQTVEVEVAMEEVAPVGGAGGVTLNPTSTTAPADHRPSLMPFVLMGAGAALAIGGVAIGAVALGQAKDAPSSQGDEADGARTLALVADIGMVLGLITAGIGLTLLVLDDDEADPNAPQVQPVLVEAAPWIAPGAAGAAVAGRF